MNKLFMSNGFRVDMIGYDEVAKSLGKEVSPGDYKNILFVAEQLQFSDDQVWIKSTNCLIRGLLDKGGGLIIKKSLLLMFCLLMWNSQRVTVIWNFKHIYVKHV